MPRVAIASAARQRTPQPLPFGSAVTPVTSCGVGESPASAVSIAAGDHPQVAVEADGASFTIKARAVLNAAGPWAMRLMGEAAPDNACPAI